MPSGAARHLLWDYPETVSGKLNHASGNLNATISGDGTRMVVARYYHSNQTDLFITESVADEWGRAVPLTALNSEANERSPSFSKDERLLFFASDRTGGAGGFDLYYSVRGIRGWSEPRPLSGLQTPADEMDPFLADGWLYFASNRSAPESLGKRAGGFDLFRVPVEITATGGTSLELNLALAGTVERLNAANSAANERYPSLNARGDGLFFSSDRKGGFGGADLYRATFREGQLGRAHNLGALLNTPFDEINPIVSPNGFRLLYGSNRDTSLPGDFRFLTSESSIAYIAFDWALLREILLVLAVALALMSAVYWLLRLFFRSQSSMALIPRCLLGSLILHIILALLSGTWLMTTRLAEQTDERKPQMTVNLHALARESVALAVRESLSALPSPSGAPASSQAAAAELQADAQPVAEAAQATTVASQVLADHAQVADETQAKHAPSPSREKASATVAQVDPVAFGPSKLNMELPDGITQRGSERGETLDQRVEERIPEADRRAAARTTRALALDLRSDAQAVAAPTAAGPRFDSPRSGAWVEHAPSIQLAEWRSRSNRQPDQKKLGELSAPSRASMTNTMGTLMLRSMVKMETGQPTTARAEPLRQEAAPVDTRALEITLQAVDIRQFIESLRAAPALWRNRERIDAFSFRAFLLQLAELNRVGSRISDEMPGLLLPAEAELEIPESMLEAL